MAFILSRPQCVMCYYVLYHPPFQVAKRASTGYDCRGQQTKHNYLSYFSIEVNINSEIKSY